MDSLRPLVHPRYYCVDFQEIIRSLFALHLKVPSSQFVFGSSQSSGAPDLIVTSSNSGLQGQEGLDRTAMDIQVTS